MPLTPYRTHLPRLGARVYLHPSAEVIGERVSVGHGAILHGCTIGDECLIGMGSILLDGAVVGPRAIVGAGSLVPEGKVLEGGWLYVGRPVRQVRPLSGEELAGRRRQVESYMALKDDYLAARSGPCSSP